MPIIEEMLARINPYLFWKKNFPLANLTTFKLGGPADFYVEPQNPEEFQPLIELCQREGLPWFILGSGANILISDKGVRGMTLATKRLRTFSLTEDRLTLGAGWEVDEVASQCQQLGLRCLDFAAGMPSSVGGAVWMNARCYDHEVSSIFVEAKVLSPQGLTTHPYHRDEWDYKVSPFQGRNLVILEATFQLTQDDPQKILQEMEFYRNDRTQKGHYRAPCAGSIFKNNRSFGKPSGAIIDQVGLKGLQVGGARVSDWHANIIINTGLASASDVRNLIQLVKERVYDSTGFLLEEEVLYVGDWD